MVEHERDRESLVTLLSHANKMLNKYQSLLEQEEQLIDDFANERKIEVRKLFSQLRCTEDERIAHLERHITDMDGELEAEVTELATAKQTNDEVVERLDTAKQRPQKQVAH